MPYINPQNKKESDVHYRERNREKLRLKSKEYYKNNKEKIKEYWANNQEIKRKYHGLPEPTHPYPDPELCECCRGGPKGAGRLHLDHDHETGKFRGWLCSNCNLGLGLLGDSLGDIENAIEYLYNSLLSNKVRRNKREIN